MKYTIHSIIESEYAERNPMNNCESKIEHDSSGSLEEKTELPDANTTRHTSEAKSDQNRFFHRVRVDRHGVSQVTNVTVQIQPDKQDDPCTGCFKMLIKAFK
jgi:hypothetical protein